ncbi:MAG: hypothetical protein M3R24_31510 [Chloroflexota bacterium]|nr:hypothetical protein [Chloroflexota bacterium]
MSSTATPERLRRDCLDHVLILSTVHLRRVLMEYVAYFNYARPQQGIRQRVPEALEPTEQLARDGTKIIGFPVLGSSIMTTERSPDLSSTF